MTESIFVIRNRVRVDWPKCEKQWKPSQRVRRAMVRLSREKFIPPDEVEKIAFSFACLCSNSPHSVVRYGVPEACLYQGMLNGLPPFPSGTYAAVQFVLWLRFRLSQKLKIKKNEIELKILKLTLCEMDA